MQRAEPRAARGEGNQSLLGELQSVDRERFEQRGVSGEDVEPGAKVGVLHHHRQVEVAKAVAHAAHSLDVVEGGDGECIADVQTCERRELERHGSDDVLVPLPRAFVRLLLASFAADAQHLQRRQLQLQERRQHGRSEAAQIEQPEAIPARHEHREQEVSKRIFHFARPMGRLDRCIGERAMQRAA